MALTIIRKVASFVVLAMAICALIASWVAFERPYLLSGTIGTIVAIIIPQAVVLGIVLAAATRKPPRSPNYPRIEHLRIAGKYHPVGRYGEMGSSPLNLRG